ncbi:unnamed protein product [Leptidea sinapis]|uniref:Uncharacterized protein n=1 Tax=Leptidea sinapis TaxID=189913 RepID=A0A5E4QEV1_9NEOP|nr:unnamed protein product [Leptidea sinapis]
MKFVYIFTLLMITMINVEAQVPYDYIPIGRAARRDLPKPHPSDVNMSRFIPFRSRFPIDLVGDWAVRIREGCSLHGDWPPAHQR